MQRKRPQIAATSMRFEVLFIACWVRLVGPSVQPVQRLQEGQPDRLGPRVREVLLCLLLRERHLFRLVLADLEDPQNSLPA
jgi:hypothetical protein